MPNRKIKHIVAKLVGASTEETLDVYDVDAIHTDKIYNALDQTAAGYVLDARQGKALNDSLTNKASTTELQTVENKIAKTINIEKTTPAAQLTLARYTCSLIGNKIVLVDIAFNVTGTLTSNVLESMFYFPNREFLVATDLSAIKINAGGGQSTVVPFFASDSTNRIGVNGSQTSFLTSGTSWNLLGVVILK